MITQVYTQKYQVMIPIEQVFTDKNSYHQSFYISSRGYLPGERLSLRFKTEDGEFKEEYSFIPNPIKAKNKSKTVSIEAELISLSPAIYGFTLNGFEDNERLTVVSISGKEKLRHSFTVTKKMITISPDVQSEKGAVGKVIFTRKSGEEIQINLPWGYELFDYVWGNKIYKIN